MSDSQITFLSDKNKSLLFNYVRKNIYNNSNIDMNNDKKYYKIFVKLCEKVLQASPSNTDLNMLNSTVINKTIPYFNNLIQKTSNTNANTNINLSYTKNKHNSRRIRELETKQNINIIDRPNNNVNQLSINEQFNKLNEQRKIVQPKASGDMFTDPINTNNVNNNRIYSELVNERRGLPKSVNHIEPSNQNDNLTLSYDSAELSGLSISNLSDDLSTNIDITKNPMELYQSQANQRNKDTETYRNFYDDQKQFQNTVKNAEKMEEEILSQRTHINQKSNNEFKNNLTLDVEKLPDPRIFMNTEFKNKEVKVQLDRNINNMDPIENPNYESLKNKIFEKQNYIERVNFVSINSRDRNWANDTESRYTYTVNFDPSDDPNRKGVGIGKIYKNVISVQLMKIILGQDNTPLPFDNRIYLGLQSYPFLVLHIDELDGVYYGSNTNLDKSFAHLVFDKEYKCDILTSSQVTNETSQIGTNANYNGKNFEKQYTRGFMGYIPIGWEQKVFYPAPLASLSKMSIRIRTPDGDPINTLRDNLDISAITIESVADLQVKKAASFPKENSNYIKIATNQYFNNRNFRIGDKIIIENYNLVTPNTNQKSFIDFINRTKGHYIVNLTTEVSTNNDSDTNDNEGFINAIYISPPGNYKDSDGSVENTITGISNDSLLDGTSTPTSNYSPRLLNLSLQNQLIFKVTTRDQDTNSVMNILNS